MAELAELDADREATLDYFIATDAMPVTLVAAPGGVDLRDGGGRADPRRVRIRNGRREAAEFRLEKNGFRFVRHGTKVADFYDETEIRRVYYREMEALVKQESGAARVVVFDHTCAPPTKHCARRQGSATRCAASTTIIPNGRRRSGSGT